MAEDVGHAPAAAARGDGREMARRSPTGRWSTPAGCGPLAQSTEIRVAGGKVTTADGPYAEAKEVVGGYAIIEAAIARGGGRARPRVIELHLEHWPGWEGSVEIRPITEPDEDRRPADRVAGPPRPRPPPRLRRVETAESAGRPSPRCGGMSRPGWSPA